jgi:DNA repair photolyase
MSVMRTITRKSLLYKSGLGFHCVNHVQGCSHGCRYPCYAFMMARSYGRAASYEDWRRPRLVANAPELLAKELGPRRKKPDMIHLCLTTDPFMFGQPEVEAMSLELVAICNAAGVPCSLLTKGLLPVELADRERFPSENAHGISLVSLDEGFRGRWEPGAAPYAARVAALRALHDRGLSTFAHIEPYPTPDIVDQDIGELLEAVGFVDSVFFGGWNYNAAAARFPDREAFYREQAKRVRRFCKERGIGCDIGI